MNKKLIIFGIVFVLLVVSVLEASLNLARHSSRDFGTMSPKETKTMGYYIKGYYLENDVYTTSLSKTLYFKSQCIIRYAKNKKGKATIEIIKGVGGLCVSINDYRVCGNKPWGGGVVIASWKTVPMKDITQALIKKLTGGKQ